MIAHATDQDQRPATLPPCPCLPEPCAPQDALHAPFVGNASVDDNLKECVQVGLFVALGPTAHKLTIDVADGIATLSGPVVGEAQRQAALKAAGRVTGVTRIIDCLTPAP